MHDSFCLVRKLALIVPEGRNDRALNEIEIRQRGFPLPFDNLFGKGRQNSALPGYNCRLQALIASDQPIRLFAHIIQ